MFFLLPMMAKPFVILEPWPFLSVLFPSSIQPSYGDYFRLKNVIHLPECICLLY